MIRRTHRLACLASAAVMLAVPATAAAASVEVRPGSAPRSPTLVFLGEETADAVTVELAAEVGKNHEFDAIRLVDSSTTLSAGAGCTGGGAAGAPAVCVVHEEVTPITCAAGACRLVWTPRMELSLGGGDDLLDGSRYVTGEDDETYGPDAMPMIVFGGSGADSITTSNGQDVIEPGDGNDVVHAGGSPDEVLASALPDGDDLIDTGAEPPLDNGGSVSYSARSEPIRFEAGIAGGAGESDTLLAELEVVGGAGADQLVAPRSSFTLRGGPGPDTLVPTGFGSLYGGPGDDRLLGNSTHNQLYGESGDDLLLGEGDRDMLFAGPGDDVVRGGSGDDRLRDGIGRDLLAGESGKDLLYSADQRANGDHNPASDSLECGDGFDQARLNPWDRNRACERLEFVPQRRAG